MRRHYICPGGGSRELLEQTVRPGELHHGASPASRTVPRGGRRRGQHARSFAADGPGAARPPSPERRRRGDGCQGGPDPRGAHPRAGFEALDELLAGQPARRPLPEILAIAERRGVTLKSDDPADVHWRLLSLPWYWHPAAKRHALLVADPEQMPALLAPEVLLRLGRPGRSSQARWRATCSGAAQKLLARFATALPLDCAGEARP
jgi:hypothetical protein